MRTFKSSLQRRINSSTNILIAVVFALSGFMPIILMNHADAAQLTSRKVTISTSQPDATGVTYDFAFTTATSSAIQSMIFQFCTTPLGTCTLPGGSGASNKIDVSQVTASSGAFTGTNSTAFTDTTTDTGACTEGDGGSGVATMLCATRTQVAAETPGAKTFSITGISNPTINSGNNEQVYVRITTYSDAAYATAVDTGVVAASIVNQLTVTGRVQERLVFCMFALEDADSLPTDCADTEASESTSVDLGVIDNISITRSPEDNNPPTSIGNDRFGAAMINTNASSGVALTYYASAAGSGTNELRAFRVTGATCDVSGTSLVDQCFISADDSAGETFTAGTERFGVHIACVNYTQGTTSNLGENSSGTPTSGSGSGGSYNTVYSNVDDSITDAGDCENSDAGNKYGWRDSGTAQALISSVGVVDDEIVKLRYGATASATTPTGTYTVSSVYIATPTF